MQLIKMVLNRRSTGYDDSRSYEVMDFGLTIGRNETASAKVKFSVNGKEVVLAQKWNDNNLQ